MHFGPSASTARARGRACDDQLRRPVMVMPKDRREKWGVSLSTDSRRGFGKTVSERLSCAVDRHADRVRLGQHLRQRRRLWEVALVLRAIRLSAVGAWSRWCSTQRPVMEASRVMRKMGSARASASHSEAAAAMRQQRDARLSQARAALAVIEMRVGAQGGRCLRARRRRTTARISAAVLRRRNPIGLLETSAPNQRAPHPSNRAKHETRPLPGRAGRASRDGDAVAARRARLPRLAQPRLGAGAVG